MNSRDIRYSTPPGEELGSDLGNCNFRIYNFPNLTPLFPQLDRLRFAHLPSASSRSEHVLQRLSKLSESICHRFPVAHAARDWIQAHLPSSHTSYLLHGDLLPQNLTADWNIPLSEARVGIVDWEMARIGDPAYDLAIVSRANRKVLGVESGLRLLVRTYLSFGGQPISMPDVRVHEILLVLDWLEETWQRFERGETGGQPPAYYEQQLQSVLRRASSEDPEP